MTLVAAVIVMFPLWAIAEQLKEIVQALEKEVPHA
jgi:hypothetical protein